MNKRYLIFIFITVLISVKTIVPSLAQDPFIPKYDAFKRSERCFTITDELDNQFGSVWWADKIDFSSDTVFNFVVYMGSKDDGADGLAFVMHKDPRDTITDTSETVIISGGGTWNLSAATGDDGGGLGYSMHNSREGPNTIPGPHGPGDDSENHKIQPSVAVEIDTYYNKDVQDGDPDAGLGIPVSPYVGWDHTAVVYNGDIYNQQQTITDALGATGRILPLKPDYAFGAGNNNIEDDGCYTFQIRWDVLPDGTQDLELWADTYDGTTGTGGLSLIMTFNDDMITNVFGGDATNMRFGFTGSTGGKNNEQTVCLLGENLSPLAADDYVSMAANSSEVIDVLSNDNDPDNDDLFVPVIIDFPLNGLSVIFDSVMIDGTTKSFLRYTPNANYTGKDSLSYVTCDVNSTKCYAKCDTAFVYIAVGCVPFDVDLTVISPNTVCTDTVPDNGSAGATAFGSGIPLPFWTEDFSDLNVGDIEDTGLTAWTWETPGDSSKVQYVGVDVDNDDPEVDTHLEFHETRGNLVNWSTEVIDISAFASVSVSFDLYASIKMNTKLAEAPDAAKPRFIKVYYKIDGGAKTLFFNGSHDEVEIPVPITLSLAGVSGSSIQILIEVSNGGGGERYFIDDILFSGSTPGPTTSGFTFNWYDGVTDSGPIVYTGAVNNGMSNGMYTVVAIDDATGCLSNPATITIDSAGSAITGGFIKQLSPFTNCAIPYDGTLEAGVFDGSDSVTVGYSFDWYFQEDPKISAFKKSTGSVFQNLVSRDYSVVITEAISGCDTTINEEVINEVILPTLTATNLVDVTSCSDPNSGSTGATVFASGTQAFWTEDFSDLNVGDIEDTGSTSWTWVVPAPDDSSRVKYVGVGVGNDDPEADTHLEFHETRGEQVNWSTEAIDISSFTDVSITFDLYASIKMNEKLALPPDASKPRFIKIYYKIDGGAKTLFSNGSHDEVEIPTPVTLSLSGVNGSSIQILIEVSNGGGGERYFIDDIVIDGKMPPGPTTVGFTFNWYDGITTKAIPDFVGSGYNTIPAGQYTVVAIDDVTSCISDPATVTVIDLTVLPLIEVTVDSEQISCDTLAPTGKLSGVVNEGGPLTTSGYSFNWYKGPRFFHLEKSPLGKVVALNRISKN